MNISVAPTSAAPQSAPVSFSGRARDFFAMLIKGSLLQIPTFGFYRFWLITKLRRHLWSNTRIAGEAFEYTGTAKELLIGFLIAIAILIPIYIGYFVLTIMAEEQAAFASIPLVILLYGLAHFAGYRARRYRASRTTFRGLRFWMTGAGWAYAGRAILYDLVVLLTLGLAWPWTVASLERYRMRHTRFGTLEGDFIGTGWTLFKRAGWIWLTGMIAVAAGGALIWRLRGAYPESADTYTAIVIAAFYLLLLTLGLIAGSIISRWQLDGLRFGKVAVSSNLAVSAFVKPFLKMLFSTLGLIIVFSLLVAILAVIAAFAFGNQFAEMGTALQSGAITGPVIAVFVMSALAYLILFLGLSVIKQYFLGRGLWVVIVNSLSVSSLGALETSSAAGGLSGATGEGFADALDFEIGI